MLQRLVVIAEMVGKEVETEVGFEKEVETVDLVVMEGPMEEEEMTVAMMLPVVVVLVVRI